MPVVLQRGYPFGCQHNAIRLILFVIDFYQVGWLAPAFITIIFAPDPTPVPMRVFQYLTTFPKHKLTNHFCPVRRLCPEGTDGDATNCSDHGRKLKNESPTAKFYPVKIK